MSTAAVTSTPSAARVLASESADTTRPVVPNGANASSAVPASLQCRRRDGRPLPFVPQRNPWDIHCYFSDARSRAASLELRAGLMAAFPWLRQHKLWDVAIGPHTLPMWEVDFGLLPESASRVGEVVEWLVGCNNSENMGLSILVHPNTSDGGVADHTEHAIWIGRRLPVKLQAFSAR
jgi:aromatic ring-cleaving dioxygenase